MDTEFLKEIADFCRQAGITHTRFGKLVFGSPAFVSRLRAGAKPRRATVAYARRFMAENRGVKLSVRRGRPPRQGN